MGTFLMSFQGDIIKEFQHAELWYSELWHAFPTILGCQENGDETSLLDRRKPA
jgi:hypothetical protein